MRYAPRTDEFKAMVLAHRAAGLTPRQSAAALGVSLGVVNGLRDRLPRLVPRVYVKPVVEPQFYEPAAPRKFSWEIAA